MKIHETVQDDGTFDLSIEMNSNDIDLLINALNHLKENNNYHFHIVNNFNHNKINYAILKFLIIQPLKMILKRLYHLKYITAMILILRIFKSRTTQSYFCSRNKNECDVD